MLNKDIDTITYTYNTYKSRKDRKYNCQEKGQIDKQIVHNDLQNITQKVNRATRTNFSFLFGFFLTNTIN
jgi:hypothetical protein